MKKILVTGITGNSGKYFTEELITSFPKDTGIRALVRVSSDRSVLNKLIETGNPVELFEGDVSDIGSLDALTKDVDIILHLAGVGRSLELVKAAIPNGVKTLILVHTTGIYSKYKAAGESYRKVEADIRSLIAGKNIDLIILRPTMIYGSLNDNNMVKFIKMTDRLRFFPMVKGGHYALQPVHQQDLGKAYMQILNMVFTSEEPIGQREYILSGGTVIDLIDIMKLISECLGRRTTFFSVPFWFAYAGAWGLYVITFGRKDFREKVQRLVEPRSFSHEKASRDFGYAPIDFADGIRREVDLYKRARG